jgi:hypothetical protein
MRRTVTIVSATLLTAALAAPAMAQTPPINTNYGEHHQNVENFDGYLDQHQQEREEQHKNPELIDNPKYLAKHPDLNQYMQQNPQAAKAFKRHPYVFEHREHVYNRSEERYEKRHGEPAEKPHHHD